MFYQVYESNHIVSKEEMNNNQDIIHLGIKNLDRGIYCNYTDIDYLDIDLNGNVLINGITRTGKSFFAETIAEEIEKKREADWRIYFDVKDDYIRKFYKSEDKVISFRNNLGSYNYFKFNLVKEVRMSDDPDTEIREITNMLITEQKERANDPFFCMAAAQIFRGYIETIIHCYSNNPTNKVIIQNLKMMSLSQLKEHLLKWPANRNIVRDYLGEKEGEMTKMTQSIMACLTELLDLFSGNFCDEGEDTIHGYIKGSYGRRLFFEYDYGRKESSNAFFRFFLSKLIRSKLSQTTNREQKFIFFLDEIAVLNGDFGLMDALTIGAGNGLQIIVITQSLEKLYCLSPRLNNGHITNASLAGFASVVTFRPADIESIKKLEEIFGEKEFQRITFGISRYTSPTAEVVRENNVSSKEFSKLGVGEFYAKIKNNPLMHGKLVL